MSHSSFYEVIAQIIPVLFLALVVQLRFYEWQPHHAELARWERLTVMLLPVVFISTEAAALYALLSKVDSSVLRAFCVFGLGVSAALVISMPIRQWYGSAIERESRWGGRTGARDAHPGVRSDHRSGLLLGGAARDRLSRPRADFRVNERRSAAPGDVLLHPHSHMDSTASCARNGDGQGGESPKLVA